MKVEDLIKELENYPKGTEVRIFDWRKNLHDDCGDGSSSGIYDVKVSMEDLSEDEKEYIKEMHGIERKPFIQLYFESDDYSDEGVKYE